MQFQEWLEGTFITINISGNMYKSYLIYLSELFVEVYVVGYEDYGIDRTFVERIKIKMKNPQINQRVKMILNGVSKADLQDSAKLNRLLDKVAKVLGEKLTDRMSHNIVTFVISQKIDPNNTFHLIKLWGMFR
jgi:GDP-D-mannose dehydratase